VKARFPLLLLSLAAAGGAAWSAEPTPTITGLFRVVKTDGSTVLGQAVIAAAGTTMGKITVSESDALVKSNGRCAFNIKYDEVSNTALTGTVNRFYSNDALVAQNTSIDLQARVARTFITQPYLVAGQNNVRVVLNATGAKPTTGWVQVNVTGTCKASVAPPPPPVPAVVPGSAAWNALYNAWGYSNYGTTQLKGKGYARYADLVKLNADLTAVVNAKKVEQTAYNELMTRWNSIANDAAFKALMAKVVPGTGGK
jgi:hypothetical protein